MIRFLSTRVNLFIEPIVSQGYWVYHLKMLKKKANKTAARKPAKALAKKVAKKAAKKPPVARPAENVSMKGRPSGYSSALAEKICAMVREGTSLRRLSQMTQFPTKTTICRWLQDNEDFRDRYARAMRVRIEMEADALLDICDDGSNDWMMTDKGYQFNGEHFQRSKLRVETRKFIAIKLLPEKYGEKIDHKHEGGVEVTIRNLVGDVK